MSRRVVVTGRGVISALGKTGPELHDRLCAGEVATKPISLFDADRLETRLAGEISGFDARAHLGKRNLRPLDRTGRLVAVAAQEALRDSGWNAEARAETALGLVLGTMFCSVHTISEFDRRGLTAGPKYVSALDFANSVINAAAGQVAIWHDLRGINTTISTGAASGLQALGFAAATIRSGQVDVVLAGGAEELCFESCWGFEQAGALAAWRSPRPVPFDAERNGMILGEGAAFLVFEAEETARSRGARVLAEVTGTGLGFDPSRGKEEASSIRATRAALLGAMGKIDRAAVSSISAAANGTEADRLEGQAILDLFPESPPVMAPRAGLGETLGAGGALASVVALEALGGGQVPGVTGLARLDPSLAGLDISAEAREIGDGPILLSAVSRDGHRAATLLSPWKD